MAKVKTSQSSETRRKIRPAINPENREAQLAALAMDLVEQRLLDGTASSQETTYFLKTYSTKAKLENEILELNKKLVAAKTEALESAKEMKVLYEDAIKAMRRYSGQDDSYDDD